MIHHVQLACPPGSEPALREFYGGVLGLDEIDKPPGLAARGGCWFGGPGIKGFAGFLDTLHVPAPTANAVLAGLAEFAGGLLIALGLFPRLAAIPFAATMLVAWATAHHGKFFAPGGGEYPLTLAVMAAAVNAGVSATTARNCVTT